MYVRLNSAQELGSVLSSMSDSEVTLDTFCGVDSQKLLPVTGFSVGGVTYLVDKDVELDFKRRETIEAPSSRMPER